MQSEPLSWVGEAHTAIAETMATLTDAQLGEPSLLPDWTRAHVLAHIARNADGLANLVTWAATGVERPMYTSAESRAADIEVTAALPSAELRAEVLRADDALLAGLDELSADAEAVMVRALFGDAFPAGELPNVRSREAWVHLVDLDAGVGFGEVPAGLREVILAEAVGRAPGRDLLSGFVLEEEGSGRRWVLEPADPAVRVTGPQAVLLEWLTGRGPGHGLTASTPDGALPEPPPWP